MVLQVKFHIQVQAGNSRKVVAVIAIKRLEATWIILDREMKKEKRYFMEKLSCGISKLKSDNSIDDVRGPLTLMENTKVYLTRNTFSYDEMIPGDDNSLEELPSPHQRDLRMPLNWERRLKIALGAARGLEYLHKHNIIHRDIRPNNILITHDHESLLGDFGLAKAGYDESQNSSGNNVVGTLGYMAPEYAANGKFSAKTDVYAFGVVLLQLITGLKTTDKYPEDKSLVEWAMPLLEQRNYPRLIDKRIADSHDFHQLFWMVELAGKCLEKDANKRHTMEWVVKTLSHIMEGNADNSIDFNTKGNNEDDKILGTVTTSSCSTDSTCSSKRWSSSSSNSTHEECERRKIPLKHKGPSPNKSKLLYKEMIH